MTKAGAQMDTLKDLGISALLICAMCVLSVLIIHWIVTRVRYEVNAYMNRRVQEELSATPQAAPMSVRQGVAPVSAARYARQ